MTSFIKTGEQRIITVRIRTAEIIDDYGRGDRPIRPDIAYVTIGYTGSVTEVVLRGPSVMPDGSEARDRGVITMHGDFPPFVEALIDSIR